MLKEGQAIEAYTKALTNLWDLVFDGASEEEQAAARAEVRTLKAELEMVSKRDEDKFDHLILYMYAQEQREEVKRLEKRVQELEERLAKK